jgi:endonuclease III
LSTEKKLEGLMAKPRITKKLSPTAEYVFEELIKLYPEPRTALEFTNPLELLVAVILSAQCTDERVNKVTRQIFRKYRSARDYASVPQEELEQDIKSTGFFRNKARSIRACCAILAEKYSGNVPDSMVELVELPGVGRKTANCVLGSAYGQNSGIVVDTHVKRLVERLKLSNEKDPDKIESDLLKLLPKKRWHDFGNLLILHGRAICDARKPRCPQCVLKDRCPSAESFMKQFWN